MSYEPYRNQQGGGGGGQQQGYGSYNPYAQNASPYESYGNPYESSGNPYAQSDNPYQQQQSRPQQPPAGQHGSATKTDSRLALQQSDSNYSDQTPQPPQQQPGGDYEMNQMNGDPNRLLNEVKKIDQALDDIAGQRQQLQGIQQRYLQETDLRDDSPLSKQINRLTQNIKEQYAALVQRVRRLKSDPESGSPRHAPQVGKVDRRLKQELNKYQEEGARFRKSNQEQIARQYLIARPDATQEEINEAIENPNQQVFAQSLMQTDRRGEAQRTMQNVRTRHDAIQKIEKDIAEIAQLYQDLNALVVQQEPQVQRIEQQGEVTQENVQKATEELGGAITKAKAARRKKWWCLIICILIVAIAVGVGCGVYFGTHH